MKHQHLRQGRVQLLCLRYTAVLVSFSLFYHNFEIIFVTIFILWIYISKELNYNFFLHMK